ncbi:uncharacterized protein EAE98_008166 [Botrytis deweyae]|uniref:F-box domain-containing protein n=1 Tax=Botrytis deweyae TaxID=2478750 RepID=A0ABQ7IEN5_9HELO|nr:uncharacterized protein EAE98_008166 [Botrytis deweyae]KAF7921955.1 hypothetical protein EAE98_008166 [Botrytis deweyae]
MAKKKNSSRQKSPEDAAKRLKEERLAILHAEVRQEMVQRRILAVNEIAANRTKLHFLSSKAVATGPVEIFDRLLIEVMRQIFKELTDIDSLHSLISTSRSFHECYINDQYQCEVFCKMLVDEMTLPIFLQAVAISSDSVRRIRWTGHVREFMDQYSTDSRATTYDGSSYNMRTLLSIAEFHLIIKAVARDFFESCLNLHPWTHEKYEKSELGRHEELRIQRAFHNLELYVRLFKRGDYYLIEQTSLNERLHGIIRGRQIVGQEIYEAFFDHFSFWELEEIVSVKDYMEREYNDVINECKDFLAKSSQAQQSGSPSTLKRILEAGNIKLGSCDDFRKHYNEFNRTFINKGVEFFWKVCNQNGPKTKIPLIDIPIQQDKILLSTQFTKIMTIHYYLIDQASNNQQSQIETSEYLRFLDCYDRSPESRAGQLDFPSAPFTYSFIRFFMISQKYCFRDCWSSWGYCMWDTERLYHIQDIFWPTGNPLRLNHGPRSRLSSRVVLLPAL